MRYPFAGTGSEALAVWGAAWADVPSRDRSSIARANRIEMGEIRILVVVGDKLQFHCGFLSGREMH
ncbi:MAG: hypothetical protein WA824_15250, partial [Candidatus Sulfotelmatobacter sp.]